jgi:hypothetical protein
VIPPSGGVKTEAAVSYRPAAERQRIWSHRPFATCWVVAESETQRVNNIGVYPTRTSLAGRSAAEIPLAGL